MTTTAARTTRREPTSGTIHRRAVRVGRWSMVLRPAMVVVMTLSVAALVRLFCVSIGRGDYPLSIADVLRVMAGSGSRIENFVVMDLRLPRTLTGILVGAALGLSGAITQSVARNALASPDLLGITAGSGAAAVALIVFTGSGTIVGVLASIGLSMAALLGGLLAAVVVYAASWRRGVSGFRLILVGIGVNAFLTAVTSWMLISADIEDVARAQLWLTGSLNGSSNDRLLPLVVTITVMVVAVSIAAPKLAAMRLGDDTAQSLGVDVARTGAFFLLAAVVLAAVATAAAGPIGFVALAAPQIALRLFRSAGPPLLGSAVWGALLVTGSDVIARTVLPVELPVGIVTSALGGPFLIYLLVRRSRKASV